MLKAGLVIAAFALLAFSTACSADTFTERSTGEVLHGYAAGQEDNGETLVRTQEKGEVKLNLRNWQITPDRQGRNNKVIVLTLDNQIMLQIEIEALIESLKKAADDGPLFILLQIDTPGGRIDFAKQLCSAITQTSNCQVVSFIKDGQYGGAISAGAALALACDKIYMAENTVIGAAALITLSARGPKDLKETYGGDVGEKVSSVWRTYLAALAEHKHRPGLLAGAMVDSDIEVIEVSEAEKRFFIDPSDKKPQQELVQTWSRKGSLLTLTAEEAVRCGIADKLVRSQAELLKDMKADRAELVIDNAFQKAGEQFKRAKLRYNRLTKSLESDIKELRQAPTRNHAMKLLRDIQKDYKSLITLSRRYPDLNLDVRVLERQLNRAEELYEEGKSEGRFLR
jgi:membrane-bound ClpP family serine protease